jgi:hypothetical protein
MPGWITNPNDPASKYIDELRVGYDKQELQPSIDITPEMRESVLQGQPQFQKQLRKPGQLLTELKEIYDSGDYANKAEFIRGLKELGYDSRTVKRASVMFGEISTTPEPKKLKTKLESLIEEKDALGNEPPLGEAPIQQEKVISKAPSKVSAFDDHLEYFSTRQLEKGSEIRVIQKKIQVINGKRLSGVITAQEANNQVRDLRKELMSAAHKEGVAVRMTPSGKVMVSVRKSGAYVPESFNAYGDFKDVEPNFGGTKDITRYIQEIDGSLTVAQKAKIEGQAGPVEQNVLWATRDISTHKLKWQQEKMARLVSILKGVKPNSETDKMITDILRVIESGDDLATVLNKSKEITKDESIASIAKDMRQFYDDMIDEQNLAREMRNQDAIPFRRNYSPETLRDATIWERVFNRNKTPDQIIIEKVLPDYIRPNKPFNPRELANEHNIPYEEQVKSAIELAQLYLVTASKDIFNTSIIENNKAFIKQLEALDLKNAANYLSMWTAEAFAGITMPSEKAIPKKTESFMRGFNQVRNMAVFPFNFAWSMITQPSSFAFTAMRYKSKNVAKGMMDWLDPEIRKQASEDYYSFIVKTVKQGRISRQDAENLIGDQVKLYNTPMDMIHDFGTLVLDQMERLLTGISIRAAYHEGKSRGLEGEALRQFASDGGSKTQSMYNDEDKPRLLRSLAVKTAAPFQTFTFEVTNTLKEWAGKTGTPPSTQKERIMWVVRFIVVATVFQTLAKFWNKDVWDWKRPPLPFAEFWLNPIIDKLTGGYTGGTRNLPSPVSVAVNISKGVNDYLVTGDTRKIRQEVIKYGPGFFNLPGGVAMARAVDAIIAYADGGVRDRRGKIIIPINTPQDLMTAIFAGVWATEGGQEYLDKRKSKETPIETFIKRLSGETSSGSGTISRKTI